MMSENDSDASITVTGVENGLNNSGVMIINSGTIDLSAAFVSVHNDPIMINTGGQQAAWIQARTEQHKGGLFFKTDYLNSTNEFDGYIQCSTFPSFNVAPFDGLTTLNASGTIGIEGSVIDIGNFANEIYIGTMGTSTLDFNPLFGPAGFGTPPNANETLNQRQTIVIGNLNSDVKIVCATLTANVNGTTIDFATLLNVLQSLTGSVENVTTQLQELTQTIGHNNRRI